MIREGLYVKENYLSDMLPYFLSLIVVEVLWEEMDNGEILRRQYLQSQGKQ